MKAIGLISLTMVQKKLYANGEGLIERLVNEFPRFNDSSEYKGIQ